MSNSIRLFLSKLRARADPRNSIETAGTTRSVGTQNNSKYKFTDLNVECNTFDKITVFTITSSSFIHFRPNFGSVFTLPSPWILPLL
jgi:hypothetical protein